MDSTSTSGPGNPKDEELSDGEIAGIVVLVMGATAVAVVAYYLYKNKIWCFKPSQTVTVYTYKGPGELKNVDAVLLHKLESQCQSKGIQMQFGGSTSHTSLKDPEVILLLVVNLSRIGSDVHAATSHTNVLEKAGNRIPVLMVIFHYMRESEDKPVMPTRDILSKEDLQPFLDVVDLRFWQTSLYNCKENNMGVLELALRIESIAKSSNSDL